jgi:hypothetical protein
MKCGDSRLNSKGSHSSHRWKQRVGSKGSEIIIWKGSAQFPRARFAQEILAYVQAQSVKCYPEQEQANNRDQDQKYKIHHAADTTVLWDLPQ